MTDSGSFLVRVGHAVRIEVRSDVDVGVDESGKHGEPSEIDVRLAGVGTHFANATVDDDDIAALLDTAPSVEKGGRPDDSALFLTRDQCGREKRQDGENEITVHGPATPVELN